jgi:hypothetical protein
LPIPAQQRLNRKAVPKVVHTRGTTVRVANCSIVQNPRYKSAHSASRIASEGVSAVMMAEKCCTRSDIPRWGKSCSQILEECQASARGQWYKPRLVELGLSNKNRTCVEIHIGER